MKCVLHIGTEKTGTSSLQEWLYANQKNLAQQRIALSDVLEKTNNRKLAAYFQNIYDDFFIQNSIKNEGDKTRYFKDFLDSFVKEVAQSKDNNDYFVITSEHFHSRLINVDEIEALAQFLSKIFREIKVVCYFREQSEVRKSLYSTVLRNGKFLELSNFYRKISPDDHYFNYFLMLSKWADVFGQSNIEAVLYDRNRFLYNDIRKDFISRVSPDVDLNALNYETPTTNEKFSYLQAKAAIAINRKINRNVEIIPGNKRNNFLFNTMTGSSALNIGELFDPGQKEFFDLFKDSNEKFFQKFFNSSCQFKRPEGPLDDPNRSLSFNILQVSEIVSQLIDDIINGISNRFLFDEDANILRDVALKYEKGESITKDEAIALMQLAYLVRPKGPLINQKLKEWEETEEASVPTE